MPSFLSSAKNVGIDISDFSVEILSLNSSRRVIAYDREFLPEGTVVEGEIKKPAYLAEIIKRIFERNKVLKGKKISASFVFPKIKTFISHFDYDKDFMAEELDEVARREVLKFFPDSLDTVVWDFAPANEKKNKGEKKDKKEEATEAKRKMLYAVAGKLVVDGYTETAKFLGLKSFCIEIEPILLRRALMSQAPKDSTCMVVDIGANATSLYIFTSGETIEYTANTKVGGKKLTEAIAEAKKISFEEAEKIKLDRKLWDAETGRLIIETYLPIKDVILYLIEKHEQTSGETLTKIILVGGGALLPDLDVYFKNVFQKEVVLADPTLGLKAGGDFFRPDVHAMLYANVIGSGLKHLHRTPAGKNIDFAPKEFKKKDVNNKFLIILGFFAVSVILALYFFLKPTPVVKVENIPTVQPPQSVQVESAPFEDTITTEDASTELQPETTSPTTE